LKGTLLCLLLFYATSTLCQKKLDWREVVVVLRSEQVLSGRLTFEPILGVILFESANGNREVYSAYQVHSLNYYDARNNINRRYVSLKEPSLHRGDTFYEIVVQGNVSLVRRQIMRFNHLSDVTDFNYFTWFEDKLSPMRHFKRSVYPVLEQKQAAIAAFRTENQLHPGDMIDAIQLIEFYNKLTKATEALARQ
jgi:hypothetical protein